MINPALTASRAGEHNLASIIFPEGAFLGDPSPDRNAEFSSGCTFIYRDMENWLDWFSGDISSAAPLVRILEASAYASDPFSSNLPHGSSPDERTAIRRLVPMGTASSCPDLLPTFDRLDALLALRIYKRIAPGAVVEAAATSPSLPTAVEAELAEFGAGLDGVCPTAEAVRIARVLSAAAVRHVPHPEITVDIDGELSFDLRLKDGRLVFAEFGLDGQIDVGVYGPDDQMLEHDAEATCEYFLSVIAS